MNDRFYLVAIAILMMALLPSCFEKDERMPPQPPGEEADIALQKSIYDYQVYFDFSTGTVKGGMAERQLGDGFRCVRRRMGGEYQFGEPLCRGTHRRS